MKPTLVRRDILFGGLEIAFKSDNGTLKAYEAEGSAVEPYLIGISLFHAQLSVCPHMVQACCKFESATETLPEIKNPLKLACRKCLDLKDISRLEVASWSTGKAFSLQVLKFPDDLYGCWLTSEKRNPNCPAAFQGLGYECVAHWQRIAKESSFKIIRPLAGDQLEAIQLAYVSENI